MKIPSSYDIIGSREKAVAIIEVPDELIPKKKEIAKRLMKEHKNVKSVLRKVSERKGVFRTREYELLVGEGDTEITHKESGCRFRLDPQKVYFSGREGTERLRIAEQVKPNEFIMVMFGGVAPYGILISKKQPLVKKIISIEINSIAHEYAKENIKLNKVEDKVIPILEDVREKCKEWYGKCDRVLMPLPHGSWNYLNTAYNCLKKKGGIIHIYFIAKEENAGKSVKRIINDFKKWVKKRINYKLRKVLPYAPKVNKYCVDIRVLS